MNSSSELRKAQHHRAQDLMQEGKFREALALMRAARDQFGPHVGLLCDIACCFGLLNQRYEQIVAVRELESEMEKAEPFLSKESLAKTAVVLSKLKEDMGFVVDSLKVINDGISVFEDYCSKNPTSSDLEILPLMRLQRLRLNAFLFSDRSITQDYSFVACRLEETKRLRIEYLHSLMIAELVLIGEKAAVTRLEQLRSEPDISASDWNLALFDLVEALLRSGHPLSEKLQNDVRAAQTDDVFESTLQEWMCSYTEPLYIASLTLIENQIGFMNFLRLLNIALILCDDDSKKEVNAKLELCLSALDAKSESIMRRSLARVGPKDVKEIRVIVGAEALQIGERKVELGKRTFLHSLLAGFAANHVWDVEAAIGCLYGEKFSEHAFEKLRVAVRRARQNLNRQTGLIDSVRVSKDRIILHPQIRVEVLNA